MLLAEDPLKPTISEAILSYGPTVIMFVVFIAIVIYIIKSVKNKHFRNKRKKADAELGSQETNTNRIR